MIRICCVRIFLNQDSPVTSLKHGRGKQRNVQVDRNRPFFQVSGIADKERTNSTFLNDKPIISNICFRSRHKHGRSCARIHHNKFLLILFVFQIRIYKTDLLFIVIQIIRISRQHFICQSIGLTIGIGISKRTTIQIETTNRHGIIAMTAVYRSRLTRIVAGDIEFIVTRTSCKIRVFYTGNLDTTRFRKQAFLRNNNSIVTFGAIDIYAIYSGSTINRASSVDNDIPTHSLIVVYRERIVATAASHVQRTDVAQSGKGIITNTTINAQLRTFRHTFTQVFSIGILNSFESIFRSNALCTSLSIGVVELSNLEGIVSGAAINIRYSRSTINDNLVIATVRIQINNVNTIRKVDAFDILIGIRARYVTIFRQQRYKTKSPSFVHSHQQVVCIFRGFNSEHIPIELAFSRIGDVHITGFASAHQVHEDLVAATLAINEIQAGAGLDFVISVSRPTFGILVEYSAQAKIFAKGDLFSIKRV